MEQPSPSFCEHLAIACLAQAERPPFSIGLQVIVSFMTLVPVLSFMVWFALTKAAKLHARLSRMSSLRRTGSATGTQLAALPGKSTLKLGGGGLSAGVDTDTTEVEAGSGTGNAGRPDASTPSRGDAKSADAGAGIPDAPAQSASPSEGESRV